MLHLARPPTIRTNSVSIFPVHKQKIPRCLLEVNRIPEIMALRYAISPQFAHSFIPLLSPLTNTLRPRIAFFSLERLSKPCLPQISIAIPAPVHLNIPSLLSDLWDSILRAVPKKKTSHRKKRQRFMAGKALKDVTNLNKCSACGNVKRAHLLCPYCVRGEKPMMHVCGVYTDEYGVDIKDEWLGRSKKEETTKLES